MLKHVTITGADDNVSYTALHNLALEFPFVEWGLLVSGKRSGEDRYPSAEWLHGFPKHLRHSLHLCGSDARAFMDGTRMLLVCGFASRIQLNGWSPGAIDLAHVKEFSVQHQVEVILQCRRQEEIDAAYMEAAAIGGSVLLDASGGTGKTIEEIPASRMVFVKTGYAGGLGQKTAAHVVRSVRLRCDAPFWVDMESNVRTNNRLDLEKVRAVLEEVTVATKAVW